MIKLRSGSNSISYAGARHYLSPGERGIDAMLRGGAPINFSCRKGTCHACMLQAVPGDPGAASRDRLPASLRDLGFFLPRYATEVREVVAQAPDLSLRRHEAVVADKIAIGRGGVRRRLEPMRAVEWKAGQRLDLQGQNDEVRPYSIASTPGDYFIDLDIRLRPDGALSRWIDRDLLLAGTGTGGGALLAIAREALDQGHRGRIRIFHGARTAEWLYLAPELDPYEARAPSIPDDAATMRGLAPDPDLWAELDHVPKLSRVLAEFCGLVYADERLAPFFHRVPMGRAIQKQYSFLRDLLAGTRDFFGEKPFASHHWMVISDELFDHREALFAEGARRHGVSEAGLRRWLAVHESFRRAIVKPAPRGLVRDGQEVDVTGFSLEQVEVGTVCNGCHEEIAVGARRGCTVARASSSA